VGEQNKAIIKLLLQARLAGDTRTWDRKAGLSREALRSAPDDFYIDSRDKHIVGLTHSPTGFRFHLPENQVQSFKLQEGEDMTNDQVELLKAGCFSVYKQAGLPEHLWEPMFVKAAGIGLLDTSPGPAQPKSRHQIAYEKAQAPKPAPKVTPTPGPAPAPVVKPKGSVIAFK
jgi:hypothetical protein